MSLFSIGSSVEGYRPELGTALGQGRIDLDKTKTLINETAALDCARLRRALAGAIPEAPTHTVHELRRLVRHHIAWLNPTLEARAHSEAMTRWGVWIEHAAHAMAWVKAYMAAKDAHRMMATLTAIALDQPQADSPQPTHGELTDPISPPDSHTAPIPNELPTHIAAIWQTGAEQPETPASPDSPGRWRHTRSVPVDPLAPEPPASDFDTPPELQDPHAQQDHDEAVELVGMLSSLDPKLNAREYRTATLGNCRADLLADLFAANGNAEHLRPISGAIRPRLVIHADASTLLGLNNLPGELSGYGAIPATQVRDIAQHSTWQLLLTDPRTGRLIEMGSRLTP
ncbi:MAG: DUF222 domain-containing protein, partial [Bifidobacteriaceae bacterium]|nr:DUF222 domain-containing protein [Bifidobacteriaceae bacterium]